MGRVRLQAGGVSPGEVRLSRRGASEKLTPAGTDIRDVKPDSGRREKTCSWCGSTKAVILVKRRNRCGKCRHDQALVAKAKAALQDMGASVLGAPGSSDPVEVQVRKTGVEAQERLEKRRRAHKSKEGNVDPGRALNVRDRARVLSQLEQRITALQRKMAQERLSSRRAELRQDLAIARRLQQQLKRET